MIYSFFFFRIFLLTCKKLSSNLLVKIISSFSLFYLCIKYTYFPPRIIIYYSHVKIYPILEKHFWLLLSLLPIMIHKELLKKKKKNHTNFRSKTKKMPHTHGIYLGFLLYYVILHCLAPTIIIESFWTKNRAKNYRQGFRLSENAELSIIFSNIFTQREYNIPKNNTETLAFS